MSFHVSTRVIGMRQTASDATLSRLPARSLTAYREVVSLRQAARRLGFLTDAQFDLWVRPEDTTHPLPPSGK